MVSPQGIFVIDADGVPLMPASAPRVRQLLTKQQANLVPYLGFNVAQLTQRVKTVKLRPVLLGVSIRENVLSFALLIRDNTTTRLHAHIIFPTDYLDELPYAKRVRRAYKINTGPIGSFPEMQVPAQRRRQVLIDLVYQELSKIVPVSHVALWFEPSLSNRHINSSIQLSTRRAIPPTMSVHALDRNTQWNADEVDNLRMLVEFSIAMNQEVDLNSLPWTHIALAPVITSDVSEVIIRNPYYVSPQAAAHVVASFRDTSNGEPQLRSGIQRKVVGRDAVQFIVPYRVGDQIVWNTHEISYYQCDHIGLFELIMILHLSDP